MAKDVRSRKWLLTINNPVEHNFPRATIRALLKNISSLVYYCISDEIGGVEHTEHTHIYIYVQNAVRFSTLKKLFPTAHIDNARGSSAQNRDYVFKEGKWLGTEKEETNLRDTHEEYGELPIEKQGERTDLADLFDMIKSGASNMEILEECPQFLFKVDYLDKVRQTYLFDKFKKEFRNLEVSYVWGVTGKGKTRGIMERYGYENVYRVTDAKNGFDNYKGEDIIVFEEFYSNEYKIRDMLNLLDGYPLQLPCRYANKCACYTKVYLTSNVPLSEQYKEIQDKYPMTWDAFVRRIHNVITYKEDGSIVQQSAEDSLMPF